jgi:hypothetical protein
MEKAVHKDSGEAVSDLALSKGINIDGVDSQTLFTLVRRVRAPPVTFGHIDSIQEGGLYSRTYLYKVRTHIYLTPTKTLTNQCKKLAPCTSHLYTKLNAHRSLQGGVNGNLNLGCDSVVVSRQSQAHKEWDGLVWLTYTNIKFQGGAALWFSFCNSLAIRVFVSSDGNYVFVPLAFPNGKTSYRSLGLFEITCAWDQDGLCWVSVSGLLQRRQKGYQRSS